jgi:GT2 family glycosyltransferase
MRIEPPKIAMIIVNYRSAGEVVSLIRSLRQVKGGGERNVYIVDSNSADDSKNIITPELRENEYFIEIPENLGYGACNNVGIRKGMAWGADYFLILNPDIIVESDFLSPLVIALEARSNCGIATSVSLSVDGSKIQSVGGEFSLLTGRAKRHFIGRDASSLRSDFEEADFAQGHVMLVKKEFFEDAGLFHEDFFLYYEDVELGLRGRKEYWHTVVVYQSKVRHKDTTKQRYFDPLINYVATRNQIWVERIYASSFQYVVFLALSILIRWPWKFTRSFFTLHLRTSFMVIKGIWRGLFGKGMKSAAHLAIPVVKRKIKMNEGNGSSGEIVAKWIQAQDAYLITKHKMDHNYRKRMK